MVLSLPFSKASLEKALELGLFVMVVSDGEKQCYVVATLSVKLCKSFRLHRLLSLNFWSQCYKTFYNCNFRTAQNRLQCLFLPGTYSRRNQVRSGLNCQHHTTLGKACQGQTLKLILPIRKLQP
jgi:hypothetical protein